MTVTITINLELEVEVNTNQETVKEAVYEYLSSLIDDDSLNFKIEAKND